VRARGTRARARARGQVPAVLPPPLSNQRAQRPDASAARRAAELHYARALLRLHMGTWRSSAHASYRARMHAELDGRWADAAQAEASKFAVVVSRLEAELAAARCARVRSWRQLGVAVAHARPARRSALEREVAARTEAEERFKQAFMRGVCALNFEALAVLKTGAGAAGVEPSPRQTPVRI
jgi:hypothetical protein